MQPNIHVFREAARDLPIAGEFDVIVCGGGPAGIGAAIAASRNGAKTLLIERYGFLGGMATAGLVIPHFDGQNNSGINAELIGRLKERQAWGASRWKISFDPEMFKHMAEAMAIESGVTLMYHSFVTAPILKDDQMIGVIVENKSGREVFLSKVIIDTTGDGDVAARAGCAYNKGREQDGLMQPMSYMFRMGGVSWVQNYPDELFELCRVAIETSGSSYRLPYQCPWAIHLPRPNEVIMQLSHVRGVDGTDARDLTRAEIEGRKQVLDVCDFLKSHVKQFSKSYLIETATQIGIRETRRIVGEYTLSDKDVLEGEWFDDGICNVTFGVDIHDPVDHGQPVFEVAKKTKGSYQIPYRSLVPKGIDQLLIAGRCISGTHIAHASYRVKGPCMAMGEAAGTAAGLSVREGIKPRDVDVQQLRFTLQEKGVTFPDPRKRIVVGFGGEVRSMHVYKGPG